MKRITSTILLLALTRTASGMTFPRFSTPTGNDAAFTRPGVYRGITVTGNPGTSTGNPGTGTGTSFGTEVGNGIIRWDQFSRPIVVGNPGNQFAPPVEVGNPVPPPTQTIRGFGVTHDAGLDTSVHREEGRSTEGPKINSSRSFRYGFSEREARAAPSVLVDSL